MTTTAPGTLRVTAVLFTAPVFFTPDYWSESARAWAWVQPDTPVEEKPVAEFEVSLDVTLGEVFEAACGAWNIEPGPHLDEYGATLRDQFTRFAFVVEGRDPRVIADEDRYDWPETLPVARESGDVELVHGLDVTFRELAASSRLGLIEGDVTRPYVDPVIPQGEFGQIPEIVHLTIEAIRAAYVAVDAAVGVAEHTIRLIWASLPEIDRTADAVIEKGTHIGALYVFYRWIRKQLRLSKRRR
jgi:hypothetical protein